MLTLNQNQITAMISAAQNAPIVRGCYGKSVAFDLDLRDFAVLDSIPANTKIPVLTIKSHKLSGSLVVSFFYNILSSDGSPFVSRSTRIFWSYSKNLTYPGRATGKTLRANLLDALGAPGQTIIIDAYRKHAVEILSLSQNPPTNVKNPTRSY